MTEKLYIESITVFSQPTGSLVEYIQAKDYDGSWKTVLSNKGVTKKSQIFSREIQVTCNSIF